MQRGIVVDIQSTHWVVMTSDDLFLEVPKQDPDVMTGEEVSFSIDAAPSVSVSSKRPWIRYFSGAVAAMFALFFLFTAFFGGHEAQAQTHVYVEIHPGVEIGLNEKGEVVQVRPIHKEAEKLLDGLDWKKEPVKEVVVNYLAQAKKQGYLQKKDEIVLSEIIKDENEHSTLASLRTVIEHDPKIGKKELNLHVYTFSLPEVIKEKAETTGLTPGKYGVWLLSKKSGKEIPVEQISKMSLSDLTDASLEPPPSEKEWKELVNNEERQNQKPVKETNQSETKPNTNTDQLKNTDQQTTNPTSDQKRTPNQELKEDDSPTKDPTQKKEESQTKPNEKEENGSIAGSTTGSKGDSDAQTNHASP